MASTRSGAVQVLEIAEVADVLNWERLGGPGTGFEGLTLSPSQATTDRTSGGFTTTRKNRYTVTTGSFSIGENLKALQYFLGKNGKRYMFRWSKMGKASGRIQVVFQAICSVTRTANDRSDRTMTIDLAVDGPLIEGMQP